MKANDTEKQLLNYLKNKMRSLHRLIKKMEELCVALEDRKKTNKTTIKEVKSND